MLIGISGKAGSGKTTAANHIAELIGGTRIALGDAVKEEVAEFITSMGLGFESRHLYGCQSDREESMVASVAEWCRTDYRPRAVLNRHVTWLNDTTVSITYRKLLQVWGTEYRRAQSQAYWTDIGRAKALQLPIAVIDDIRFVDEAEMVRAEDGVLIRLHRPGGPRISTPMHDSETALDDFQNFTWNIVNNGTLEDFKDTVEHVIRKFV